MSKRTAVLGYLCLGAVATVIGACSYAEVVEPGQSGKLVQGPVKGATIFADNISDGVRFTLDADKEISTTTDENGNFVLPSIPKYNYVLISKGGTDRITNQPAIQMVAPAGSANVTPLTTLVALDTTGLVKAKLEALMPAGVKYDADLSTTTSPAALLVSKSVENIVQSMSNAVTSKAGSSTISPAQISAIQAQTIQSIAEEFAKPAVTATTLSTPNNLTTSLQTAATASTVIINTAGNVTIPAATANTIAASSVTATTTALKITSTTSAATTVAITGGEITALSSTAVVEKLNADVKAATTAAAANITATATPTTYVAPPIQVIAPPASLYIAPAAGSQTIGNITFTPSTLTVGKTTTASAVATSKLPVTFKSNTTGVCTVVGTTVTAVTTGLCIITAEQSGNASYSAASAVKSSIIVTTPVTGSISVGGF